MREVTDSFATGRVYLFLSKVSANNAWQLHNLKIQSRLKYDCHQGTAFYNEWLYTEQLQERMEGKHADFGGILIIDTLDWASFLVIRFHVKAAIYKKISGGHRLIFLI